MDVREVMTTNVITASVDTSLQDVARLLIDRRISGLPIVDSEGTLVGVVSETDFLVKQAGPDSGRPSLLQWLLSGTRAAKHHAALLDATTAGEAMTRPPITIAPDRPLSEAAALMAHARINRLPVMVDGRLAGILTRADIVRAYARTDEELVDAVREAVRAVDGLRVVGVHAGVATLAGDVASPELMPAVHSLVGRIGGIIGVDDKNVTWSHSPDRPAPTSAPADDETMTVERAEHAEAGSA